MAPDKVVFSYGFEIYTTSTKNCCTVQKPKWKDELFGQLDIKFEVFTMFSNNLSSWYP